MKKHLLAAAMILSLGLSVSSLRAQQVTATLTGTITDSSGAVVPNATITVHDNAKGVDVRTATADSTGNYTIAQLPYGTFTVTIEAKGFQKYVVNDVALHVGDRRTLNAALNVGQVSQEITVTAAATPLETSTSSQEGTITGTQVRELQLNNRNFELLLTLQPGVASTLADSVGFGGIANTSSISVNGARTAANNWMVDGSDVNDSGSNLTVLNVPSIDALTEFKLVRSTYDAQYGRSLGGQVNVVTKSGTSDFHGDVYEFFRNDVLNAVPYFVNSVHQKGGAMAKRPPFRYNDYGFTIGGPLYIPNHYNTDKSKTFFFWSEEWRKTRTPTTVTGTLPPPQELTGNFQGLATLNPALAPAGCISNNTISQACFSANAQVYLSQIYDKLAPNLPNNQIVTALSAVNDYRQDLVRLDQRVNDKVQVFARWMNDQIPTTEPGGLFAGSPLPGISSTATNSPGRNLVLHMTMQVSPSVLNEVAFNYTWGAINSELTGLIGSPALFSAVDKSGFPSKDPYGRSPSVSITGLSSVVAPSAPYHERNVDKELYDNVSLIHSNHSIRFGVSNQWMRKSENGPLATNGSFAFNSANGLPSFANFLLGNAATFTQADHDVIPDIHFINLGAYVQDDWKARSNLTLNLGLRYDYLATPHDINGILTNFDPALFDPATVPSIVASTGNMAAGGVTPFTYLNGIIVGGKTSPYGNQVNPTYKANFSPRFGLSWDPFKTGLTTIRAGYGIYYDRTLNGIWEQNQFANPPVVATASLQNASFDDPSSGTPPASLLAPRNLHATGRPAFKVPYNQDWNLAIQRQVARNTIVEVAYVGGKGTHLLGEADINQVPAAARLANTTDNRNALRPFLGYGVITDITPEFKSNYHSLQISGTRRVSNGLTFGVAYTWSKTLTNSPSDRSDAPYDSYNWSKEYGPATFSRPSIFVANYVYELPFYKGQQGLVGHALGGWEISGITSLYDGVPVTIRQNNDPFDTVQSSGIGIDPSPVAPRPNCIAPASLPHTVAAWYNVSDFAVATGNFGNCGRGILLGPGRNDWDMGLFKTTRIGERFSTQFRAEFFNAWNHTSFSSIQNNIQSSNKGAITGAHDPRIIQLALKLYF